MSENNGDFNKTQTFLESIREINKKYKTPRITMTPFVRFALIALRVYLLVMLLVLCYKFVTLVIH